MVIVFQDANEQSAGAVSFSFSFEFSPQYLLAYCEQDIIYTDLPTACPIDTEEVWRITLTRTLGIRGVVIHCNKKVVLNVTMSDTTCKSIDWETHWSRDVKRIMIPGSDTATKFYRPGNGK